MRARVPSTNTCCESPPLTVGADPGEQRGEVVLVKLGGSLITEKGGDAEARASVIRRLAAELREGGGGTGQRIVLGHGSGSFGHPPAAEFGLRSGARSAEERRAVSRTQDRAARLHRRVVAALVEAGLSPYSIAPSSAAMARDGEIEDFGLEPLAAALRGGYLPVVYGDVVADRRRGATIASTERLFLRLSEGLPRHGWRVARCLWLGVTAGVYDGDGRVLPRLGPGNGEAIPEAVGGSPDADVTGGMRHRVETALRMSRLGVCSWIGDGRDAGSLVRALAGRAEGGTRVPADG